MKKSRFSETQIMTILKQAEGGVPVLLVLANVQGFKSNHKRVYRIYRELELNMCIKPRKRLKREKPESLAVPDQPNHIWSMDHMLTSWRMAARSEH